MCPLQPFGGMNSTGHRLALCGASWPAVCVCPLAAPSCLSPCQQSREPPNPFPSEQTCGCNQNISLMNCSRCRRGTYFTTQFCNYDSSGCKVVLKLNAGMKYTRGWVLFTSMFAQLTPTCVKIKCSVIKHEMRGFEQ